MGFGKYFSIILFALMIAGIAYAVPAIPHQFYGTVTVNGNPAHGAGIIAKINGVQVASTASSNGNYGYYPNVFFVTDPNSTNAGKKIQFFLNGTNVAEFTFKNGESTQLNLSVGTSSGVCGDGTCNASENCGSCAADCGTCTVPPVSPPAGGGGGGGGSGGGGSGLLLSFDGNCIGKTLIVKATLGANSPADNATVNVMHNQKNAGSSTTDAQGKATFTFAEIGKYTFTANKGYTTSIPTTTELFDCSSGAVKANTGDSNSSSNNTQQQPAPTLDAGKLCSEINCNDSNPCTIDSCTTGVCVYNNAPNGTKCPTGTCQTGICIAPTPQQNSPTGFVSLPVLGNVSGIAIGLGLVVIVVLGIGLFFITRKK